MSRHDQTLRLKHMLDHAREAVEMCANRSRKDLDSDRVFELALVRLLEIVGEAANRVPKNTQQEDPDIGWAQIIAFRNRLIHGYDQVDLDILWQIIQVDLPPLIERLEKLIARQE